MGATFSLEQADVVVIGGGFAGLAAGTKLAGLGLQVTVLDAGPAGSFRGELLHPAGARALADLGLRSALLARGAISVPGFAAYAGDGSEPVLLPYPLGAGSGLALDHGELLRVLRSSFLAQSGARILQARGEDVIVDNGRVIGVRTADGMEMLARLVVVADGRHSRLRTLLGFRSEVALLSFTLAPLLQGVELPFPRHGHVFVGGPGPILAYPYDHERIRMVIDVPTGVDGGRRGMLAFVRDHHAAFVPEPLRSAMLDALERGEFESSANHAIATERCVAPGVALVGDSTGCAHPITAAGLTIVLNDVMTLAASLSASGLNDRALLDYQRRRYRFARARAVFTQSLYEVLRGADAGSRGLREGMFQYWRSSERARVASMAILAGEDSRPQAFAVEYSRVMASSVAEAARRRLGLGLIHDLPAMLVTAGSCLDLAVDRTWATVALEATRGRGAVAPVVRLPPGTVSTLGAASGAVV